MENTWRFLKKWKIELQYILTIPWLGIYQKEVKSVCWKNICFVMFIAVLVTLDDTWNQGNCPTELNGWSEYGILALLSLNNEQNLVIYDKWMNYVKWNTNITWPHLCVIWRSSTHRLWNGELPEASLLREWLVWFWLKDAIF